MQSFVASFPGGSRGKIHQAFWLSFCILQAIKNRSRRRPGNEASPLCVPLKNRLVVLTTERLVAWLHGLCWYISLYFSPLFLIPEGGNNKGTGCLMQLASTTKVNHATMVTTGLLKQLVSFYSDNTSLFMVTL